MNAVTLKLIEGLQTFLPTPTVTRRDLGRIVGRMIRHYDNVNAMLCDANAHEVIDLICDAADNDAIILLAEEGMTAQEFDREIADRVSSKWTYNSGL